MRNGTFRVAFIGERFPRVVDLLARLSPAFHPVYCREWEELAPWGHDQGLKLVVPLPGEATEPPFPLGAPVWVPTLADLDLPPDRFEAKLLAEGDGCSCPPTRLLGCSPAMARFRGSLSTMAKTTLPILLSGENGTGKDLAAEVAHDQSARAGQPFVAVNCGAVPTGLAETEFFGCVRGAFTGAENRSGFCQQALGGTLFLDEIGELAPEIQAKLLRALENQEVRRVGSVRVETVDFRLICATNRDLAAEVKAGRFREDLYYRINVLPLRMPALRERKEDIPLLATHFLGSEALGLPRQVRVGPRGLAKMADYHWPGNLRQLRNVVVRAAVLHRGPELGPDHIVWDC